MACGRTPAMHPRERAKSVERPDETHIGEAQCKSPNLNENKVKTTRNYAEKRSGRYIHLEVIQVSKTIKKVPI